MAVSRIRITSTRIQISLFTMMRIRNRLFTLMWIRRVLVKVMWICDHWSTDPPRLHFEPLRLHHERLMAHPHCSILVYYICQILDCDADQDPALPLKRIRILIFFNCFDFESLKRIRILLFSIWFVYGSSFPKLCGSMQIRIRNTVWGNGK